MQFLLSGYYLHLRSVHAILQSSSIDMDQKPHAREVVYDP